MKVGIIGGGSFGLFLAEKLDPFVDVMVNSRSNKAGKWAASLKEVADCDYVIPSIPLDAYESVLTTLKPLVRPDTVIVDVCSVKEKPIELIRQILPNQTLVATHPLFGPESAADSLAGHCLVVCRDDSDEHACTQIEQFAKQLQQEVITMSAAEHDEEMAIVQGLTFFIARSLKAMGLHHQKLETPSFRRLLHLAELEAHHSDDLFHTIQTGNKRTAAVREKFAQEVKRLNDTLK